MTTPAQKRVFAERIAFLRGVTLFAELKEKDLADLAREFQAKKYYKGDVIFRQGDDSREVYLIMKGKVRIFHLSLGGDETTINILIKRQLIGEFAIIDGQPRSATAKAISPCTLLTMTQPRYLQYLENVPGLAVAMCKQLVSKVRWTSAYAETIAQYDTAGRLLHFILLYNEQFGVEMEANKRYLVDLGLNQTDLATLVGARRQWINRILQDWRKRGMIEFSGGKITILDIDRVREERDMRIAT